jgi:hypothetical protein
LPTPSELDGWPGLDEANERLLAEKRAKEAAKKSKHPTASDLDPNFSKNPARLPSPSEMDSSFADRVLEATEELLAEKRAKERAAQEKPSTDAAVGRMPQGKYRTAAAIGVHTAGGDALAAAGFLEQGAGGDPQYRCPVRAPAITSPPPKDEDRRLGGHLRKLPALERAGLTEQRCAAGKFKRIS